MFSNKRLALGIGLMLVAILLGFIAWSSYRPGSFTKEIPEITLKQFEEKLASFKGKKPVVLNFWASWCPPCREEAQDLEKTWQKYKGRVEFIGIDIQNDTIKDALDFLKEFGITYPQIRDHTNQIATTYKITGVPETFLINKQGEKVDHIIGATTEASLSQAIEEKLLK